ncbi:DJ-1/PfpI family protein [Enterococcus avium]
MKKVLLLLANGFESYEASVFTDVFGWNLYEGDQNTELVSVGFHPVLSCIWGYSCIPMRQIEEVDLNDFDALVIPAVLSRPTFMKMLSVRISYQSFSILIKQINQLRLFVLPGWQLLKAAF